MILSCSQGCPRKALNPWAGGATLHHELMGEDPGLPYRLKGGLLTALANGAQEEMQGKSILGWYKTSYEMVRGRIKRRIVVARGGESMGK